MKIVIRKGHSKEWLFIFAKGGGYMATIRTTIQVQDKMSQAFRSMNSAMQTVISSFEHLQRSSSNAVNTASIQSARRDLALAESAFNDIESEIREANQQQQQLNNSIQQGSNEANGLLKKIGAVAATYVSLRAAGDVISLSDSMTNINARLDMINDGLQTTKELQQMIFDSAQRSYGYYGDAADLVGKLAMNAKDAFASNAEAVLFGELLNKQFIIAGTAVDGMKNATIQLTQALGGGVLRGEELNSIFEHAPNIIHTIADYLDVPIGKIREMAADGEISAQVVKAAMFSAADEINEKFASMPLTFSQIWTSFKNEALWAFQDVLQQLNNLANSDHFQKFVSGAIQAVKILAIVVIGIFEIVSAIGGFIYDNWSYAEPAIVAATVALVAYGLAMMWVNREKILESALTAIATVRKWAHVFATIAQTAATYGLTAAMAALGVAIAANPIGWLIGAIVVLVLIIYLAVAAVNHFAGTSISATGIIAGAFAMLGAVIWNIIAFIFNILASLVEFFVNVWRHPMYSVKKLFASLVNNVLDMAISMVSGFDSVATNIANAFVKGANMAIGAINWIIDALNKIPGVDIGKIGQMKSTSSITSTLKNIKSNVNQWVGDTPADYWEAPKMKMKSVGGAWDAGYSWGANLFNKDSGDDKKSAGDEMKELLSGMEGIKEATKDTGKSGKDTAGNTKKMAESMDMAEEDLKYLRDLAEREVINRFTTAEIKVDMSGMSNNINNEMDLDGVVSYLEEKVYETMTIAAEGDHD
ncbi:tape measure protein [Robertmurraya siralis]|uniref:tape measure protein n=1 Tax=Robertmurraya siralis TaxID=77777 RepID=UPI0010F817C4|nr:tape measure protein [Robertmurraya siralis]